MKVLLHLMLILIVSGCLRDGTDTGNPGLNQSPVDETIEFTNEIDSLVYYTCSKLNSCLSINSDQCRTELLTQTNIDTELGLEEGDYENLQAVRTDLELDNLTVDQVSYNDCIEELSTLSCNSAEIQNAYDSDAENAYEGVANALPLICEDLLN